MCDKGRTNRSRMRVREWGKKSATERSKKSLASDPLFAAIDIRREAWHLTSPTTSASSPSTSSTTRLSTKTQIHSKINNKKIVNSLPTNREIKLDYGELDILIFLAFFRSSCWFGFGSSSSQLWHCTSYCTGVVIS